MFTNQSILKDDKQQELLNIEGSTLDKLTAEPNKIVNIEPNAEFDFAGGNKENSTASSSDAFSSMNFESMVVPLSNPLANTLRSPFLNYQFKEFSECATHFVIDQDDKSEDKKRKKENNEVKNFTASGSSSFFESLIIEQEPSFKKPRTDTDTPIDTPKQKNK